MILLLFLANAAVYGTVSDSRNHPVAAAAVSLQDKSGTLVLKAETDSLGAFRFPQLAPGTYTLGAGKKGAGEATFGPFVLMANQSRQIDLTLPPLAAPDFYDEPNFVVAGVTDTTARGGHGSDTVLRSAESLAEATALLGKRAVETEKQGPLEAVREYQRAAERDPSESNLFDWGAELLVHRAPEPAIEVFTKGVRLHPASVRLLLGLAAAYYTKGSYEEAARRFFEACDKQPADPSPYLFLAKVQTVAITQTPGYTERMARFARLQPANARAQYYYAVSLWKQRRNPGEVASFLDKAVQLDPTLGEAYLQMGILHFDQSEFPQARAAFEKAIEVTPALEEAHYRLAQTYRRTGDAAGARIEIAIYERLSKQAAQETERRRAEMPQFIYELRHPQ